MTTIGNNKFEDFVDEIQSGNLDDDGFLLTYNHDQNIQDEDNRFVEVVYKKFAEQAWDTNGKPIPNLKVLSQTGAKKFSKEVLANWKKLSQEENDSWI